MKHAKAREILELNVKEAGRKMPADTLEAIKQGIACIAYVEAIRRHPHQIDNIPLPRED